MKLIDEENIDFGKLLSKNGLSQTSFRKKLIKLFYQSNSSLSIDEVINDLHNKVDKATIYRALNAFEGNGLIHKVPDKDNLLRYALCQKECSPTKHSHNHAHLLCDKCNSTYCLNDFKIPLKNEYNGFIVSNSKIILEGRCVDCQ